MQTFQVKILGTTKVEHLLRPISASIHKELHKGRAFECPFPHTFYHCHHK
jgi:hypothetical protein